MINFEDLSFAEQVRVAQETEILVGVHGAGLTDSMFMRQGAGAVFKIIPARFEHRGFRNIASMRNLEYFRTHANIIPSDKWAFGQAERAKDTTQTRGNSGDEIIEGADQGQGLDIATAREEGSINKRDEWHVNDIDIEEDRFLEVVESAIKYMYNKGPWSIDVS
ncbi:hypothetical protein F5Y19DRAFT_482079 [Xylariaceae sp. FL1651]|nr:hypothetical protein F5Y19DRAFT_482079 [Xylariaceae sp. FL1651]